MELSIESLKEAIADNPDTSNVKLSEMFKVKPDRVQRFIEKLAVPGYKSDSWLFIQKLHGKNRYFKRSYALANDIPPVILAPKKRTPDPLKNGGRMRESDTEICRLAKLWGAPKRFLT